MELFENICNVNKVCPGKIPEQGCTSSFYTMIMNHSETYDTQTQLIDAGLDPEELEFMDYEERKAVLEAAGLNPRDFDF